MAPKRAPPVQDPLSASSSEEEEGEEGTSRSEDEDDEENQEEIQEPSSPQQHTKESESESESKSGSVSDSESESEPDQNAKPIASKSMEEIPPKATGSSTKMPRSKPSTTATSMKSTAAKGGNDTGRDPRESKRAKNKDSKPEKSDDTKKHLFQRLWTEEDEIAVLQGILDFTAKKGFDPSNDMNAFLVYIKKSLHFDVSMSQLKDKIFRLKKRFKNALKGKKGEDKTFSKTHDQNAFDLSKKIWGSEGSIKTSERTSGNGANNRNRGNAKKLEALKTELGMDVCEEDRMEFEVERDSSANRFSKLLSSVGVGKMEDYVVRRGLDFVQGVKKVEMEEHWRKLHIAELELFLKRNELMREQATLMLATFKSDED